MVRAIEQIMAHDGPFTLTLKSGATCLFTQIREEDLKWVYMEFLKPDNRYPRMDYNFPAFAAVYNGIIYITDRTIDTTRENVKNLLDISKKIYNDNVEILAEEYMQFTDVSKIQLTRLETTGIKRIVRKDLMLKQKGCSRPKYCEYIRANLLFEDDTLNLIMHPEQTKETFFRKFEYCKEKLNKAKKAGEMYDDLCLSTLYFKEEQEMATILESKDYSTVTVVFLKNGKEAAGKMDKVDLLNIIYDSRPINSASFTTSSIGKNVFLNLGLKMSEDINVLDIIKIEYRNKAIWEK